jgi:ABC-2 type transport system permease protein
MNTEQSHFKNYLRIIWVIASKDMVDAIKNKTTLSVFAGVVLMMLTSQALPLILGLQDRQRLVVYDAGKTSLLETLRESDQFDLVVVPSLAEMEKFLGESSSVWLGVILPAETGKNPQTASPVQLDGYFGHVVGDTAAAETVAFFEAQFTSLFGQPVRIQTEGHIVYPTPDADGRPFMISMTLTIALIITSAFLVPYLMLEEKETRTMDVLLVSPASINQMVIGKAIAGLVYGLIAAGVVLLFSRAMVVHWGWVTLAALSGALFATAIGLLMGSIFNNTQNMNLWLGVILAALIMPIMLEMFVVESWPQSLKAIIPWVPSVLLAKLFRASFSANVPLEMALPALGVIIGCAGLVLAAVVWRIRLMDR